MEARINPLSIVLIVALAAGFSSAIDCMNITGAGTYSLTANQNGYQNLSVTASPVFGGYACVRISVSNVVLDCAGYTITGNTTPSAAIIAAGPVFSDTLSNITVRNCPSLTNSTYGVFFHNVRDGLIANNTANGNYGPAGTNTAFGFYLDGSSSILVANNTASNNSGVSSGFGYYLTLTSPNNTFINNTAYLNKNDGFFTSFTSENNTFIGNNVTSNPYGFDISTRNNSFINNTIVNSTSFGINIGGGAQQHSP